MARYIPQTVKFPQWTFLGHTRHLPKPMAATTHTINGNVYRLFRDSASVLHMVDGDDVAATGAYGYTLHRTPTGACWVDIASRLLTQQFDPPRMPELVHADHVRTMQARSQYRINALDMMTALLDAPARLGDLVRDEPPRVTVHHSPNDLEGNVTYVYDDMVIDHRFWLPFTSAVLLQADNGNSLVMWDSVLPVTPNECIVFSEVSSGNENSVQAIAGLDLLCRLLPYSSSAKETTGTSVIHEKYRAALLASFPELVEYHGPSSKTAGRW